MDQKSAIEAVGEGAKALTKLGEITEKIFGPRWTRKQADADKYALEQKMKIIRENADMEIIYMGDEVHLRECSLDMLVRRAEQRQLVESLRQEENLEKVLNLTQRELNNTEAILDEPVDDDWITRFFGIAKDVSNQDMQRVWSKILAGEIRKPGSFSLRTLDTIRNMSKKEAETFQKVLPLVMCSGGMHLICSDDSLLKKHGVLFADILLLNECGLVSRGLTNHPTISSLKNTFMYSNKVIIQMWGKHEDECQISYGVHTLSPAGIELYSILVHEENEDYAIDWAEEIFSKNKNNVNIYLHYIDDIKDDNISYNSLPFKSFTES